MATKCDVEKVEGISHADFVRQYLEPMKPVVVKDAARQWRAWERWTPEFFRDELGSRKLGTGYQGSGETRLLGELVREIEASTEEAPGPYVRNVDTEGFCSISRSNWSPFVDDVVADRSASPARAAALRAYLEAAGLALTTAERVQALRERIR